MEKPQKGPADGGTTSETKTGRSSVHTQQIDERMKSENVGEEEDKKSEDEDLTSL